MSIEFPENCRRICVIKPSALGDVVQSLPILPTLRRQFPEATIHWVINANLTNLIEGHPHITELVPFDRHGGGMAFYRLLRQLAAARFDLTIDLQGLLRTGLMTWGTRASQRIGLETAREGSHVTYTQTLQNTGSDLPAWQRYWRIAEELDPDAIRGDAELPITADDISNVQCLLAELPRPWLAVCPGARWETKRWPPEKFVEVAYRLHREIGATSVLLGSPDEQSLCAEVGEQLGQRIGHRNVRNLAGKTSLRRLAATLKACQWAITNDSGPLHLADAVGTPTLGLFTCTSPVRSGPAPQRHELVATHVSCAAGYHKTCPISGTGRHACHLELDVERVWNAMRRLVAKSHRIAS